MRLLAERLLLGVAASMSVVPLLVWASGNGQFRETFLLFVTPAWFVALLVILIAPARADHWRRIRVGVVAGTIGTIAYDAIRVPFAAILEWRLFAPISSYGVLLTEAPGSSQLTEAVGWTYHFLNGLGFAISYMLLAAGRNWLWGIAWAITLESAAVFTPFAQAYQLEGQWSMIAVAYAAHIPYGLALGIYGSRFGHDRIETQASPAAIIGCGVAIGLVTLYAAQDRRGATADEPTIRQGRLSPEIVYIGSRDCVPIRNAQSLPVTVRYVERVETIAPSRRLNVCGVPDGLTRWRTTQVRRDGGFLLRDPRE